MHPFFHDCGDTTAIISLPKIKDVKTGHSCLYVLLEGEKGDVLKEIRCVLRMHGDDFTFDVKEKEHSFPSHECQLFTSPYRNTYLIAYPFEKKYALRSNAFPSPAGYPVIIPSIKDMSFNGMNCRSKKGKFLLRNNEKIRLEKDKVITQYGDFNLQPEGEFIVCLDRHLSDDKMYIYDLYFLNQDKRVLINFRLAILSEKQEPSVARVEHPLPEFLTSPLTAEFDGRKIIFTSRSDEAFLRYGYFSLEKLRFYEQTCFSLLLPNERVLTDANNNYCVGPSQIRVVAIECPD